MSNESPARFLTAINVIGILVCTILVFIDLKIKNDLVSMALSLENRIAEYRTEVATSAVNSDNNIVPNTLLPVLQIDDNADVEVENSSPKTTPAKTTTQRRARNTASRIPKTSERL